MQTKTKQEEEILKEIRDLPEIVQEKMLKIVHFLKSEIIENKSMEEKATAEFLSVESQQTGRRMYFGAIIQGRLMPI